MKANKVLKRAMQWGIKRTEHTFITFTTNKTLRKHIESPHIGNRSIWALRLSFLETEQYFKSYTKAIAADANANG